MSSETVIKEPNKGKKEEKGGEDLQRGNKHQKAAAGNSSNDSWSKNLIKDHNCLLKLLAETDNIISPFILFGLMSTAFHLTHQASSVFTRVGSGT